LPVEAMVQVGMQKQKQYDEGIQKIQTSIDNIAGLDVARDVDKAYLQSKLNQLGNDLRTVAAGDFSNFQLVNSVSGMTNQIIKDPNIQNAVNSAAKRKKEYEYLDEARKKGELAASNEYVFKVQDSNWVNSTELNKSYNARYTPYRDVKKKAMEAIKSLHPKLQEMDIPFVMDANGKIDTSKIADAMIRQKIEGIDENQIKQAIFASMDASDINQLQIDGMYQFRGVDPEDLVNRAKSNYDQQRAKAIEGLQYVDMQMKISSDPTKLDELEATKESYQRLLGLDGKEGALDSEFYENIKEARENPDKVKYNIYRDGFVSELANAFSWKNVSKQYVSNPLKQQQNWEREFRFNQLKEQRDVFESNRDYNIKIKELEQKQIENALKEAELYGVDSPWFDLGNKTTLKNEAESIYNANVSDLRGQMQSKIDVLKTKGFTEAEIKDAINKVSDAQGDYKSAGIKPQLFRELTGPDGILKIKKDIDSYEKKKLLVREGAEKKAGVKTAIDDALKQRGNTTFTLPNGERVTLTPRELLEISLSQYTAETPTEYGVSKSIQYDTKKLSSKQKKVLSSVIGSAWVGEVDGVRYETYKDDKSRKVVSNMLNSYSPIASKIKEKYKQADEIYLNDLAEVSEELIPRYKGVSKTKEGKLPPVLLTNLTGYIGSLQEMGLDKGEEFDATTSLDYISDNNIKDTDILIKNQGSKYQIWIKNKSNPDDTQKIDISEDNLARLTGGNKFIAKNVRQSKLIGTGSGNTNLTGNPEQAEYQRKFGDFPSVKNLKVTADLIDVGGGQFYYSINLKKKDGKYQQFTLAGENGLAVVGLEQAKVAIANLTDKDIINQIIQEYPSYDISKIDGAK
jgi:hypothetical protein